MHLRNLRYALVASLLMNSQPLTFDLCEGLFFLNLFLTYPYKTCQGIIFLILGITL